MTQIKDKLIQDLASREYMRLAAELNSLVFDQSWTDDEKRTIKKYLQEQQVKTQTLRNFEFKNMVP
tara:strand:- start:41872 stop:42069 length:198 start_codon:yes stop_codon:yes gene_type:complete